MDHALGTGKASGSHTRRHGQFKKRIFTKQKKRAPRAQRPRLVAQSDPSYISNKPRHQNGPIDAPNAHTQPRHAAATVRCRQRRRRGARTPRKNATWAPRLSSS